MSEATIHTDVRKDTLYFKNVPVVSYNVEYPQFFGGAGDVNVYYQKRADALVSHYKKELYPQAAQLYNDSLKSDFPFHQYDAVSTYTVTHSGARRISLYQDDYEYTGGAHGMTARTSRTWDAKRGIRLFLRGFFPKGCDYEDIIKKGIVNQIETQLKEGTGYYFDGYSERVDDTFDPENFYLTDGGFAVFFDLYAIAPYASGFPVFEFSYADAGACAVPAG